MKWAQIRVHRGGRVVAPSDCDLRVLQRELTAPGASHMPRAHRSHLNVQIAINQRFIDYSDVLPSSAD